MPTALNSHQNDELRKKEKMFPGKMFVSAFIFEMNVL